MDWLGTCIGIIICIWNTRMTRWQGGKSHDLEITELEYAKVEEWHITDPSHPWWHRDQSW
jgi:hypothetical protein